MLKEFAYQKLANNLQENIEKGIFSNGTKLPSVRNLSKNNNLSVSTVLQAFYELEKRGLIVAKEKSGYYVNFQFDKNILTKTVSYKPKARLINKTSLINSIINSLNTKDFVSISSSLLPADLIPSAEIARLMKRAINENTDYLNAYCTPPGLYDLRYEIYKKYTSLGLNISPDDIVITNGCIEAISFSLQTVAKAGDIIAIESPTYYGLLQLIESLGMYALELPTDPITGIDMEQFEKISEMIKIKACILIPNFNNPLGSLMPDANKKALIEITNKKGIPVIESDVYSDLHFDDYRPKSLKFYDNENLVFTCSSLSKSVSAGLRIGWVINGRYNPEIEKLKFIHTISSPTINQLTAALYLKDSNYERQLKILRKNLKIKKAELISILVKNLPEDEIKISNPQGGFLLWLQLPKEIDSFELYQEALKVNLAIIPGIICSPSQKYKNFIRLSAGFTDRYEMEQRIKILAKLIQKC